MSAPKKRKGGSKVSKTATAQQRIVVLPIAAKEGNDELTAGQYLHIKDQIKQLVGFGTKTFDSVLKISPFEEFWELKDKGGVLGKKSIRVYFYFDQEANEIVILKTDKKEHDGMASPAVKVNLRHRLRLYREGHFKGRLIFWPH